MDRKTMMAAHTVEVQAEARWSPRGTRMREARPAENSALDATGREFSPSPEGGKRVFDVRACPGCGYLLCSCPPKAEAPVGHLGGVPGCTAGIVSLVDQHRADNAEAYERLRALQARMTAKMRDWRPDPCAEDPDERNPTAWVAGDVLRRTGVPDFVVISSSPNWIDGGDGRFILRSEAIAEQRRGYGWYRIRREGAA